MTAGVCLSKKYTIQSQGIHVRSQNFPGVLIVQADVSISLIISQNHNDVWHLSEHVVSKPNVGAQNSHNNDHKQCE
jgi:hypothetical protein